MKFHQLTPNMRFKWRGEIHIKLNSIAAKRESDGVQKVVPRSANVMLVEHEAMEKKPSSRRGETLRDAIIEFADLCEATLHRASSHSASTELSSAAIKISQAKAALLKQLDENMPLLDDWHPLPLMTQCVLTGYNKAQPKELVWKKTFLAFLLSL